MNKKNKILSSLLLTVLLIGLIAPPAFAGPKPEPPQNASASTGIVNENAFVEEQPENTTVNIYKLQAESYKNEAPFDHSGGVISPDKYGDLGTGVKALQGVQFTVYKIKDAAAYKTINGRKPATTAEMQSYVDSGDAALATGTGLTAGITNETNAQGLASVTLGKGYYWVIESIKPDQVSSSLAVPFGLLLPFANPYKVGTHEPGSGFLTEVNVYPKNITGEIPTVKKYVDEVGNLESSHNMQDTFEWIIETSIPKNIKDYKKFQIKDITEHVSPSQEANSVRVYYTEATKIKQIAQESNELKRNDGFFSTSITNNAFFVEMNMGKLKTLTIDPRKKLYIVVESKIADNAIMGKDIKNKVELNLDNGSKVLDPVKLADEDVPKVHTGGKRFKKVDNEGAALGSAVFVVKDAKTSKFLKGSMANGYEWVSSQDDATKFTSSGDGSFEVKGLEDSMKGSTEIHKYQLVETEAPSGYAKCAPVDFQISKTSYYKNPEGITSYVTASDNVQNVVNTRIIIPQTGGIGTMFLIIAGIAIMSGAFIAMRRNSKNA